MQFSLAVSSLIYSPPFSLPPLFSSSPPPNFQTFPHLSPTPLLPPQTIRPFYLDVHSYERSHPVANKQIVADGQGIVHFNIGDAGAGLYTTWLATPAWSAYHSAQFGHGEVVITNATSATWTWHRNADDEKTVADTYVMLNTHTA